MAASVDRVELSSLRDLGLVGIHQTVLKDTGRVTWAENTWVRMRCATGSDWVMGIGQAASRERHSETRQAV